MALGQTRNRKKPKPILTGLDRPARAISDLINPDQARARAEAERLKGQVGARDRQEQQAPTNEIPERPRPNFTEPEIIRNADTGEPTFVKMPDGRVVSVAGEKKQQVQDLVSQNVEDTGPIQGAVEATDVAAVNQQIEAQDEAIGTLGQRAESSVQLGQDNLAPGLARAGAFGVLGTAGAAAVGTAILKGGSAGAILGAPGVIIGATIAAGLAVYGAVISDKVKTKKEAVKLFTDSKDRDWNQIMNMANSGQFNPSVVAGNYNIMLANMKESERALSELAKTSIGRDLVGAQRELIAVRLWLQDEPNYRLQLALALQNPDPSKQYQTPSELQLNE